MSEYRAKNVSTEKALEYSAESRTYWDKVKDLEIIKAEERHKGIQKGLDIAEEIFTHSNWERERATYDDGVKDVIYELAKELDIPAQDIRDSGKSVDEMCADFAKRIREYYESKD